MRFFKKQSKRGNIEDLPFLKVEKNGKINFNKSAEQLVQQKAHGNYIVIGFENDNIGITSPNNYSHDYRIRIGKKGCCYFKQFTDEFNLAGFRYIFSEDKDNILHFVKEQLNSKFTKTATKTPLNEKMKPEEELLLRMLKGEEKIDEKVRAEIIKRLSQQQDAG